jgi:hypothetical protein
MVLVILKKVVLYLASLSIQDFSMHLIMGYETTLKIESKTYNKHKNIASFKIRNQHKHPYNEIN